MLCLTEIIMASSKYKPILLAALFAFLLGATLFLGCAQYETRSILCTAYCGCGECNGYTRGTWWCLYLDFWDRYYAYGKQKGEPYDPHTANGDRLRLYHPGLVSFDSLIHPWYLPFRAAFPWLWLQQDGTIAADTRYYPFGTRMYIPGWGWGRVTDVGGAIKGPAHIDLFMLTHGRTDDWGRRTIEVRIERAD